MVAWVAVEGPVVEGEVPEEAAALEEVVGVVPIMAWVAATETGSAPTRHVATTTFPGVFSATGVQHHVMVRVGREVPTMGRQACEVA